ncbi:MAG: SDR family NAD(P)-dependent oxidoreductase, partial [Candidatus Geothermincolia bacterium]
MLVDIDSEKLQGVAGELSRAGAECRTYVNDIADPVAVEALATSVAEDFGGVDVLVNVAGVCV